MRPWSQGDEATRTGLHLGRVSAEYCLDLPWPAESCGRLRSFRQIRSRLRIEWRNQRRAGASTRRFLLVASVSTFGVAATSQCEIDAAKQLLFADGLC
jgi:hypothetical protein